MQFCCLAGGDGFKVHWRLLSCSACVAAWLFISVTWLRYACLGGSHPFQVQALQTCSGQTNRTAFLESDMTGYQCYGPSGEFGTVRPSPSFLFGFVSFSTARCVVWVLNLPPLAAEPTEAVIVSIYEGLRPEQVAAIRNNRAAYSERHGYRYLKTVLASFLGPFEPEHHSA